LHGSFHHSLIHPLSSTTAFEVIENPDGGAFIQAAQQVLVQAPVQQQAIPQGEPPNLKDQQQGQLTEI